MTGAATSVDNGLEGGVLLDAAAGNFAIHADAFGRKADDYRVPSYPYLVAPERPSPRDAARLQRAAAELGGAHQRTVGRRVVMFNDGFVGVAVTQNNALYAIPGIDGEEHRTRIDARQTKVTGKGEYRPTAVGIDAVRFWCGSTDYKHNEIGLADPPIPRPTASARPSPTRSRRAASKCSLCRSICASPR